MAKWNMTQELEEKIYNTLVDNEMSELEMEETIKNILGSEYEVSQFDNWIVSEYEVSQFDNWIDDGCDEGEDEYVMGIGFTATDKEGKNTDIRVYYGKNTLKIGYVRLN